MTRINVGIHPQELPNKLLLAEHREITRIPNAVSSGRVNWKLPIPEKFVLGTGHVRFFYNKLGYLKRRYVNLFEECRKREFSVTNKFSAFDLEYNLWLKYGNDYIPTNEDRLLVINRIINEKGFSLNFNLNYCCTL